MNVNIQSYVGMIVEVATALAKQSGWEVAVETDGPQRLNCEYRAGRINLVVKQGIVVNAYIG